MVGAVGGLEEGFDGCFVVVFEDWFVEVFVFRGHGVGEIVSCAIAEGRGRQICRQKENDIIHI